MLGGARAKEDEFIVHSIPLVYRKLITLDNVIAYI